MTRPSGRSRTREAQAPIDTDAPAGSVELAVISDLESLAVTDGQRGLAATAITLARSLDAGAGMAAAAVARELRVTLEAIREGGSGDNDDVAALFRELRASVQHPASAGASD